MVASALSFAQQISANWQQAPAQASHELWQHLRAQWPQASADKTTPTPLVSTGHQTEPCIPAALRDYNALERAHVPALIVTGRLPNGRLHAFVTLRDGKPVGSGAWGAQAGFVPNSAFDRDHVWLAGRGD